MYQMGEKCIEDKRNNYKALSVFLARAMNNSGFMFRIARIGMRCYYIDTERQKL